LRRSPAVTNQAATTISDIGAMQTPKRLSSVKHQATSGRHIGASHHPNSNNPDAILDELCALFSS
jgi:hypothetical protein